MEIVNQFIVSVYNQCTIINNRTYTHLGTSICGKYCGVHYISLHTERSDVIDIVRFSNTGSSSRRRVLKDREVRHRRHANQRRHPKKSA